MTDPTSDEPGRAEASQDTNTNGSIRSRLPRGYGGSPPVQTPPPPAATVPDQPAENRRDRWGSRFLPAFWTIASIISLAVNIILLAILLSLLPIREPVQKTATDQATGLLGGLYHNFVKMDQAVISRMIPVDAKIPINIVVPVQTTTQIRLSEQVTIQSPRVLIRTGGLTLDAPAMVTLPAGQPLTVTLDFPLTVQDTIPVHLEVPVNIPLNETQLHEPFVGLQQVVEPWYCFIKPDAEVDGRQVCFERGNGAP